MYVAKRPAVELESELRHLLSPGEVQRPEVMQSSWSCLSWFRDILSKIHVMIIGI